MKNIFICISVSLLFSCGSGEEELISIIKNSDSVMVSKDTTAMVNPYKDSKIEVVTYDNKTTDNKISGFGYDILIDGKIYVHQPHIPAIPGNNGFISEEKAKTAGEFVAYKIRNNIMPPSVTDKELDSLGVLR